MCISNKFPDDGPAGPGLHSENHCPKGKSMKLVLKAISYS